MFANAAPDKRRRGQRHGQARYSRDDQNRRPAPQGTRKGWRHQGCARAQARDGESRQGSSDPRPAGCDARHHQVGSDEKGRLAEGRSDDANQASAKARDAATKGKGKAADAVGNLAKMLEDSAGTVDTKFGKQYGDYARSAAATVAGLASTLDKKDLDELAASTKDMVKKNPAIAVGAATVIGFVLARMLKGGSND